jgi:large subunit ribosomal protein L19
MRHHAGFSPVFHPKHGRAGHRADIVSKTGCEKCGLEHIARPSAAALNFGTGTQGAHTMSSIIAKIEQEQIKKDIPEFRVGDNVKVHTRVVEGDKERIQLFAGIVISRKGSGLNQAFTVRKISYGEGVERVFPLHSPKVAQIEITKQGRVRRARLHYLRSRKGKGATTVKEQAYQAEA